MGGWGEPGAIEDRDRGWIPGSAEVVLAASESFCPGLSPEWWHAANTCPATAGLRNLCIAVWSHCGHHMQMGFRH